MVIEAQSAANFNTYLLSDDILSDILLISAGNKHQNYLNLTEWF